MAWHCLYIGSENGLSHRQCQAIIWTSSGILLIGPLVTNFKEFFFINIENVSFSKMHLNISFESIIFEMVSILCQPQCVNDKVPVPHIYIYIYIYKASALCHNYAQRWHTTIWQQAITWINVDLLSIKPSKTHFISILMKYLIQEMHLKELST